MTLGTLPFMSFNSAVGIRAFYAQWGTSTTNFQSRQKSPSGTGCVKTICEKPKWKLAASLWQLSHVEWVIKVNVSPVIDQLWEKSFHQRRFLGFSHSLGTLPPLAVKIRTAAFL